MVLYGFVPSLVHLFALYPWYSVEYFKRAYSNIIRPCRDRREWQKTNGINVDPLAYDKKVGRPSKNRRKAPHELEHHTGGKKMSMHGVIIHYSYCGGPGHNIGGCKDKKWNATKAIYFQ
jgi:hypothetical protein